MGENDSSVDNQSSRSQKTDLLQALNAAAGSLQRSARSREAVFRAFEEQTAALGWQGSIVLLDQTGENLAIKALAYPAEYIYFLKELGRATNSEAIGYSFPVDRSTLFHQVIRNPKPYFVESNTQAIDELLPEESRFAFEQIVRLMGGQPTIYAPIQQKDVILGLVSISSPEITEKQAPAVEAFANHISIALENADLISALQASESRQRLLFDQASDGIFVFDENTRLIDVNRSGCRMLGFSHEELAGKRYDELITAESLAEAPVQIERLLTEKAIVTERIMKRKDGSHVAVEVSAKLLPVAGMQAMVRDITSRIQSEKALQRREKILEAIAFAAGQFLRLPSWEEGIDEVLSLLGEAAEVSRVYIFKNHLGEDGTALTTQLFEWTGADVPSQINNPDLIELPYAASGFGRWENVLSAGNNIFGHVESLPLSEQKILKPQGILSIMAVPIFTSGNWWGFIGFDECKALRDWEASEVDALQAAAGTIGAAIERQWINQQERQRRQEAEILMDVAATLTSTLNLEQVLTNIFVYLQQVVPFVSACIFLFEDKLVRAVAGYMLPNDNAIVGKIFDIGDDPFVAEMSETGCPVILEDAQKDANFKTWGDTDYVRGWMGVPLLVRERMIGYVTLDNDKVEAYHDKDIRLAQAFVNQAAVAIENAQLFAETQRLLRQTSEQTQQLQQVINIVPDGILLLDSEKRIVSVNQAGETYLSQVGEMSEDGRLARIGPYTLEALYQPIPTPPPWQELTSDDEQLLFEAAVWPLDRNGEQDHWVLVIQDITEERAKQSYRAAQERLAIVGQMAAGIAHDFNNIMAVILLYTQMLLQMPDLPPKEEKRLATIFQQSRRASDLIHQILDFSRQSLLEKRPFSVQPFLQELTNLLRRTLPENIEVILDQRADDLMINGDPTRIQQVIMNLALNARDAMPDGGYLKLSLKDLTVAAEEEAPLPDMSSGRWLEIQVRDNGKGITAEDIPHIFEPFFTTKPVGQGTGLGLAQVYGIVKQHEGFIDVQSVPNESTTFTVYLPTVEPETDSLAEIGLELPRSGKRETILVVEDDENARAAIVEILEMLNYNVTSASNGAEALTIFKNYHSPIDLVLSDMVMPVMDGTTLYLALKEIQPDVKMVMMTGYPLEESGKFFLKQNVVAWMQKPLNTEQIAQTIYRALHEAYD